MKNKLSTAEGIKGFAIVESHLVRYLELNGWKISNPKFTRIVADLG